MWLASNTDLLIGDGVIVAIARLGRSMQPMIEQQVEGILIESSILDGGSLK
ncbi:MAG TPA: hypothetical protein V6C65_28995 [Allocoleopsis sp.]